MPSALTVFVDTNVLLYAQDPRSQDKRQAAMHWLGWCWSSDAGRLSTQVLHELYANLRRVAPSLPASQARELVKSYRQWQPWAVDDATVDQAWALQDKTGYSYWDCLMVSAAMQMGCRYLLTEDLSHEQQLSGLTIINPFRATPQSLGFAP